MLFSAMFIFGVRYFHFRHMWYDKLAPKTGARKWSWFARGKDEFFTL